MTMQNAGAYLKSVREENGYSIAEVSKNTKISPAVLRALEGEGRLDNIDPVYLKGFLKIYCRFLRVDWKEFSKEYPLTTAAKHLLKPGPPRGAGPMRPDAKESLKYPQGHKQLKGIKNSLVSFIMEKKKIILAVLSVVAGAFFMLLVLRGCIMVMKKLSRVSKPAVHKPEVPLSPKRPSKTQTTPGPASSKTPAHSASSLTLPPQESKLKEITLVIRAKEESFIKVKVDGRTIYQGLLRKGNAESWRAKDNIELFVGNAAAIALEVDGKLFSSLGRKNQQLKNILINRQGLKINP